MCCSNYTPSWLELSGINGAAEDLILRPATSLLLSDPDLLAELRNATLVQARAGRSLCMHERWKSSPNPPCAQGALLVHAWMMLWFIVEGTLLT